MHSNESLAKNLHEGDLDADLEGRVEDIEGIEMFTIRSVGIDIGSSTSHLIFSRLTLRREGSAYSSRFRVTDRQVLYRSPIMLTPYLSETLIDAEKINEFVRQVYREAGFTPDQVDTGAVVITGEALKKENAQPITEFFARESGKFICASAGPKHEGLLAAHGSGAVALSQREGVTVLNLDLGGGTTKLSLVRQGVVTETVAINVGARLISFDGADVVTRLEGPAKLILEDLGYAVSLGQTIGEEVKEAFAARMATLLFEVVRREPLSQLASELFITEPFIDYQGPAEVDLVVCSGGVSEYLYRHHDIPYGDVGLQLGRHIREHLDGVFRGDIVREPEEGIRATVIGAGEYTIQASGATSHLSGVAALPAFGLKVVRPVLNGQDTVEEAVQKALGKFDLPSYTSGLVLALAVDDGPDYHTLRRIADGISAALQRAETGTDALFIVVDIDVAKSLGGILKEELNLPQEVIVVDGIDVGDLDYLDIGRPMGISEAVPVTVKSLIFQSGS